MRPRRNSIELLTQQRHDFHTCREFVPTDGFGAVHPLVNAHNQFVN
jgi:hypothetical protein